MLKKIKEHLVSLFVYSLGGTCFGVGACLIILVSFFHTGALLERLIKFVCKSILFCCGIRVVARGIENVDPQKQYIIMMNHVNIFDAFVFYSRFPGKVRGLEEESHFKWLLYGWMMRRVGQIPISRKNPLKAIQSLDKAGDLIRKQKGLSIAVLPEGTRTRTGKLGKFKKGGFHLAMQSGLDILPIIQVGSYEIKQKNRRLIKPGTVELIFEKPISPRGYSKETLNRLVEQTREVFLEYVE